VENFSTNTVYRHGKIPFTDTLKYRFATRFSGRGTFKKILLYRLFSEIRISKNTEYRHGKIPFTDTLPFPETLLYRGFQGKTANP
jgi:hypothetical protein